MADARQPEKSGPLKIPTPWTPAQARALNIYQQRGWMHPFTCRNRGDGNHMGEGELFALESGWVCLYCDYIQDWAWEFMFDPPKNPLEGASMPSDAAVPSNDGPERNETPHQRLEAWANGVIQAEPIWHPDAQAARDIRTLLGAINYADKYATRNGQRLRDNEAYISELEDRNTALLALIADIREWVNDRALPPHSEFIQGVRSAQERVRFIIAKHERTP